MTSEINSTSGAGAGKSKEAAEMIQLEDSKAQDSGSIGKVEELADDPHEAALQDIVPEKLTWKTICAIFFLGLSVVTTISCTQLMTGPALNYIVADLSGDPTQASWALAGWAVAGTVSVVAVGRLSDIFGRRWMMLTGVIFALIGAIISATAQSLSQLTAGNTINGFGFGFVNLVFTCVVELCPFKYRGFGISWVEFCIFVPWGAAAAIIANLITTHAGWRWIYYISIIYATITLAGLSVFYFPPSIPRHLRGKSPWLAFKELDFIGLGLFTVGLPVCLIGLSWAGSPGHDWSSPSVIAPIVVGGVSTIVAIVYDLVIVPDAKAFLPAHLMLRFREYSAHLVVALVTGMIYFANIGLLPTANLYIFTNDPIQIGINMLPNGMGQFFGSTVIPGLLHFTKAPKVFIVLAVFLQTLFVGLYAWSIPGNRAAWMAFQFFGQGCFDWIITCGIVNISLHARQSDLGVAIAVFGAARNVGGSIGIAVFNTILNNSVGSSLVPAITEAALAHGFSSDNLDALIPAVNANAVGIPDAFAAVPGGVSSAVISATAAALQGVYVKAFRLVFYTTIPFGVISLIVALFITDSGKYMTHQVSVQLEKSGPHLPHLRRQGRQEEHYKSQVGRSYEGQVVDIEE